MKRKLLALLAVAMPLVIAQPAAAAVTVGSQCQGNTSATNVTLASTANAPGSPYPAVIPSAGVITSWTFNVVPIPSGVYNQTLKVFRPTGAPNQFQAVGESPGTLNSGLTTFAARIPVKAGDHLGLSGVIEGEVIVIYCITGNPGDRVAVFPGNVTNGTTATSVGEEEGLQIPVTANVEPDADNDGFGDETQDQCPQNAAVQTPCPVAALSVSSVIRKGFARVLVTSSTQAPVTVAGKVKLGKGKTAKLSGNTQVVVPGTIAKFTLIFPAGLKSKLKELSRKQSLRLILTATAANIVGAPTVKTLKAKVKGQKKPIRKGKKGKGGKRG